MSDVRVLSFYRVDGQARSNGERVVAGFDVEARGIRIRRCSLLLRSDGQFVLTTSGEKDRQGRTQSIVTIIDQQLRIDIIRQAIEAFEASATV